MIFRDFKKKYTNLNVRGDNNPGIKIIPGAFGPGLWTRIIDGTVFDFDSYVLDMLFTGTNPGGGNRNGLVDIGYAAGADVGAAGTIAVTAGSATVTGTGTNFTGEFVVGDMITLNSTGGTPTIETYEVAAIASNTSLTICPFAVSTFSGSSVAIKSSPILTKIHGLNVSHAPALGATYNPSGLSCSYPFFVPKAMNIWARCHQMTATPANIYCRTELYGRPAKRITDQASFSYTFGDTSALTGTVATTAGSATVTGSSTLFQSELAVNDCIVIGKNTPTVRVYTVTAIASNTSLTISCNAPVTISGAAADARKQTAGTPITEYNNQLIFSGYGTTWTDFGTTAIPLRYWDITGTGSGTFTDEYLFARFAHGDASNKNVIAEDICFSRNSAAICFNKTQNRIYECNVPVGSHIYVQASAPVAIANPKFAFCVHGFGG
jgi:hypothetical protein